jgi:hypothetical protein
MRTEGSRLTTYNYIANRACQTGQVYADEKQLGEVYKLFRISMMMLEDAKFKMDCSFSNQELTDKEIDFALKYIQHV